MKTLNSSVFILFVLMWIKSCGTSEIPIITHTAVGKYGISYSLNDSRTRGVLKKELSSSTVVSLKDRDDLKISASWIEHQWTFKEDHRQSQIQDGEQLVIEFEPTPWMKTYIREWIIISALTLKTLGSIGDNSCSLRYPNESSIKDRKFIVLDGRAIVKDSSQIESRKIGEFTIE